jgi:hypothetical protein
MHIKTGGAPVPPVSFFSRIPFFPFSVQAPVRGVEASPRAGSCLQAAHTGIIVEANRGEERRLQHRSTRSSLQRRDLPDLNHHDAWATFSVLSSTSSRLKTGDSQGSDPQKPYICCRNCENNRYWFSGQAITSPSYRLQIWISSSPLFFVCLSAA